MALTQKQPQITPNSRFNSIDLTRTETCLRELDNITDASVWLDSGKIHAHVTVNEYSTWTVTSLKRQCYEKVGFTQIPHSILMFNEGFANDSESVNYLAA